MHTGAERREVILYLLVLQQITYEAMYNTCSDLQV